MKRIFLSVLAVSILSIITFAQSITYADISKDDVERMNFEILGKAADNYLVYKEVKGRHRISVYDYSMQLREDVPITALPRQEQLLDITFYNTGKSRFLLYQYQEGDIVFLKALNIEANGCILNEPVLLDTTMIAYKTDNKIYNFAISNNQSRLLAFKVNKKDRSLFRFTTHLFNQNLHPLGSSVFSMPMEYKGDYLTGYGLSDGGDLSFVKYHRQPNGNIDEATFIHKPLGTDSYKEHALNVKDIFLDDIKVMIDEVNNRYLLSSFYSRQKRGDIDGLYVLGLEKSSGEVAFEKNTLFDETLRKKAKSRAGIKNAFNDFFINNIVVNPDGSFTVSAEALYNSNDWDRWGFWGGPYWGGGWGPGWGGAGLWGGWGPGWGWGWNRWGGWWPYSYYSPFFYRSYWWGGWGAGFGGPGWGSGQQQFNAGNIAIIGFDRNGNKTWDNVIVKSQRESGTDGSISYQVIPQNNRIHFLINNSGKISDLENIVVGKDGAVQKGQAIQARDKRIDFMPKYGKQTGEDELIIPYSYKSNISFAKVTL